MASCNCGGKSVPTKKVAAKKVTPKRVPAKKKVSDPKRSAALSKRATRIATKKNPYAKGCNCS